MNPNARFHLLSPFALLVACACCPDRLEAQSDSLGMRAWSPVVDVFRALQQDRSARIEVFERELLDRAEVEGCPGCDAVAERVERLADLRETFLLDLQSAVMAHVGAGMDSLLLGRMELRALTLPRRDYLAGARRILSWNPGGREYGHGPHDEHGFPDLPPGIYRSDDVLHLGSATEADVAFRHLEGLARLADDLDAALPQPIAVVPTALNVLYAGVDNPVRVFAGKADPATVELVGPNAVRAEEPDGEPGNWTVRPGQPGRLVIEVRGRTPAGDEVRGEAIFHVRRVPDPVIYVAGRTDGVLIKRELTAQNGVVARNEDFLYSVGYKVRGFEMVYTPEYGSPVTANTPGNAFTREMLEVLGRTKPGDRILFRVRVELPDGSVKTLSPTFFIRQ